MHAYGKRAVAGFERANVTGGPTSTVREDDCLESIQATHFLPRGWEKKKAENAFSLLSLFFFSVPFSPAELWYRLMYHSYDSLLRYCLFQAHSTRKLSPVDSKSLHKTLSSRTLKKVING